MKDCPCHPNLEYSVSRMWRLFSSHSLQALCSPQSGRPLQLNQSSKNIRLPSWRRVVKNSNTGFVDSYKSQSTHATATTLRVSIKGFSLTRVSENHPGTTCTRSRSRTHFLTLRRNDSRLQPYSPAPNSPSLPGKP